MTQALGSSVGALQGGLRYLTPPAGAVASSLAASATAPPLGLALAAGLALVPIGLAIGAAIDANSANNDLAKAEKVLSDADAKLARARTLNPNTGTRSGGGNGAYTPPFAGGQSVGAGYSLLLGANYNEPNRVYPLEFTLNGSRKFLDFTTPFTDAEIRASGSLAGAISASDITLEGQVVRIRGQFGFDAGLPITNLRILRAITQDGSTDTGGDLPNPNYSLPEPSGYTGGNGDRLQDRQQRKLGLPSSALGIGGTPPTKQPDRQGDELGTGFAPRPPQALIPPPDNPKRLIPPPSIAPPSTKPTTQDPPPPLKQPEKKAPPVGIPPVDTGTATILGAIASATATTTGLLNQVKNQTSPENQRLNSKNGSCDALNSPECTNNLKKDIVDPLGGKIDKNAIAQDAALGGIALEQQAQKGVLATIAAKATDIFDLVGRLWNNGLIDKAMQYITMITVIHNAAMLSRGIADTLGSALDSGLQAFNLQASMKDKDGVVTGVNAVVGKSFENLIKGIIGADNYTALTNTWIQANRIYQSGINLLSNVQNILDSTTAVAELTSNRVGTLMNALRSSGSVRENAYGAQSENTTRFNAFMNKLENLEQGTSNVASITGNIVSVQQSVNELKSNRTEFENALKDKPVGTGLPENNHQKDCFVSMTA